MTYESTIQKSLVTTAIDFFVIAIHAMGKFSDNVRAACRKIQAAGGDQAACSAALTAAFKECFPLYDFTYRKNNYDEWNRKYDLVRKHVSNYWISQQPKAAAPKPAIIPASGPAATPTQVAGSVLRIAGTPASNDSANLPLAATPEELAEMVIAMATENPAWGKALALRILSL